MAILAELKDPRIRDVTVTHVEASGDLRYAKVHVSVMGDQSRQELSLRGLQHAAGYLQAKVADRLETRYTPRLTFVLDQGVKKSIEVARILREVLPKPETPEETAAEAVGAEADEAQDAGRAGGPAAADPTGPPSSPPERPRSDHEPPL